MPVTLYYIGGSAPARAVWMTCKAIGLDIQPKTVDLFSGEHLEEWYIKLNPLHTVPTFDDNGFVLWESRAIMRYVMNAYAPDNDLYPKDPKQRALVDRVLDQDLGTLYSRVLDYVRPQKFMGLPAPDIKELETSLKNMETLSPLADGHYITGSKMTIADISTFCSVTFLDIIDFDFSPYPVLEVWFAKMRANPFVSEVNVVFDEFKLFTQSDDFEKKVAEMQQKMAAAKK